MGFHLSMLPVRSQPLHLSAEWVEVLYKFVFYLFVTDKLVAAYDSAGEHFHFGVDFLAHALGKGCHSLVCRET